MSVTNLGVNNHVESLDEWSLLRHHQRIDVQFIAQVCAIIIQLSEFLPFKECLGHSNKANWIYSSLYSSGKN